MNTTEPEVILQELTCKKGNYGVGFCLDCAGHFKQKNVKSYCRFQNTRRLLSGPFGFSICSMDKFNENDDPHKIWSLGMPPTTLSVKDAHFIIKNVGPIFLKSTEEDHVRGRDLLLEQTDKRVFSKRILPGTLDSCDVCGITLFNFHWTCTFCGFMVCTSCVHDKSSVNADTPLRGNERRWFDCAFRECEHATHHLNLTNIIENKHYGYVLKRLKELIEGDSGQGTPCDLPLNEQELASMVASEDDLVRRIKKGVASKFKVDTGTMDLDAWSPSSLAQLLEKTYAHFVDHTMGKLKNKRSVQAFFKKFPVSPSLCDNAMNLKDFPSDGSLADILKDQCENLSNSLPFPNFSINGKMNLTLQTPKIFSRIDQGPKMYASHESIRNATGTTRLHRDTGCATNVMVYASQVTTHRRDIWNILNAAGYQAHQLQSYETIPGAIWHVFKYEDYEPLVAFLNAEFPEQRESIYEVMQSQYYLCEEKLDKLETVYKVKPQTLLQWAGDAIYIPAGCPHQVRNLVPSVKVAMDFVTPYRINPLLSMTKELRELPEQYRNNESRIQIQGVMFYALSNCIKVVDNANTAQESSDGEMKE